MGQSYTVTFEKGGLSYTWQRWKRGLFGPQIRTRSVTVSVSVCMSYSKVYVYSNAVKMTTTQHTLTGKYLTKSVDLFVTTFTLVNIFEKVHGR